jgi:hypothetical protein
LKTATFTITPDHITLLRAVDWDSGEGTPGIDWKRPYLGTSSVRSALAELLIPGWKEMTREQMEAVHDEHDDRLWEIHSDLSTVVAIGIDTLSFAPGTYHRTEHGWYRHVGDPEPEPGFGGLDPRALAIRIVESETEDIDFLGIGEQIEGWHPDEVAAMPFEVFGKLHRLVDALASKAVVTVEIPDEVTT